MNNLIGSTLQNRFRVLSFVASGGMSTVFRVQDTQRNALLAMKVLHIDLMDDPRAIRSFQREARALQKLTHPNIVPFFGFYQEEILHFLLELFVDGPSLKEILRKTKRKLLLEEVLIVFKALCAAIGYAHSHGVVHCDVKPGNVMIDRYGQVFLTDFGIARHVESTTTTIGNAGTPAYMAPEQIRGEAVSPATDIYALGIVLYELLTGERPFSASTESSKNKSGTTAELIRLAHLTQPAPNPRLRNPEISEALAAVVMKALEKSAPSRYENTPTFIDAICSATSYEYDLIPNRLPSNLMDGYFEQIPATIQVDEHKPHDEPSHIETSKSQKVDTPFVMRKFFKDIRYIGIAGLILGFLIFGGVFTGMNKINQAKEEVQFSLEQTMEAISGKATAMSMMERASATAISGRETATAEIENVTATAIADEITATAVAEKTTATFIAAKVTAASIERKAAATEFEKLATATAQRSLSVVDRLIASGKLLVEIKEGELIHEEDDYLEVFNIYKDLFDFVLQVDFINPYDASFNDWSYGLIFRDRGNKDKFRLSFSSNQIWSLNNDYVQGGQPRWDFVDGGSLSYLATDKDQVNQIILVVMRDRGLLLVNGKFVSELDLSAQLTPGDLKLAIGFFPGDEKNGQKTRFKNVFLYGETRYWEDCFDMNICPE